jgi:hypothetical protein
MQKPLVIIIVTMYYWASAFLTAVFACILPLWQLLYPPVGRGAFMIAAGIIPVCLLLAVVLALLAVGVWRQSVGGHGFAVIFQGVWIMLLLILLAESPVFAVISLVISAGILGILLAPSSRAHFR